MIIEGFEVENWTCIKKLTVPSLPPQGVVVLHAPNRQGKSSLVKALRACLMDYRSDSKASKLTNCYPRGSGEKPTVTVTFNVGGTGYRIKKCFGSTKSELASRSSTGEWRVETTSAADAHSRVCELAGGDDSRKGLTQLLWLTQAEFQLPIANEFDTNVRAQLRGILGVLQTPLDDRFSERVRKRWNEWYSGQRKAGKQHAIKSGCQLAQDLVRLAEAQAEFERGESRYHELEAQLRQTSELEARRSDLGRQLGEQTREFRRCQDERERSQARIAARKLAEERSSSAEKEQEAARDEHLQRSAAAQRLVEAQNAVPPARQSVDGFERIVTELEGREEPARKALSESREEQRSSRKRADRVAAKLREIEDLENLNQARAALERADSIARMIASTKTYLARNPIPDKKQQDELKTTDRRIVQLIADCQAASMTLRVVPEEGSRPARIALDGRPFQPLPGSPAPPAFQVRRKVELLIPDWGRVELSRGANSGDLDQIEDELRRCQEGQLSALASFGIAANDPEGLDQLQRRIAEHESKSKVLQDQEREFKKVAPKGLEPLQRRVLELETSLKNVATADLDTVEPIPMEREDLEKLRKDLNRQIEVLNDQSTRLEEDLKGIATDLLEGRENLTKAKQKLAGGEATANNRREELERLRTEDQINERVDRARHNLEAARVELKHSELTVEESSIDERLTSSGEAVKAIEKQIRENEEKYNRIKGRLEGSEGLHAERARLGARVDELTRLTKRETLEKDAVDRLYELFEECREKQLGTWMGPIQDRVLTWMRVLDIGDYKEVRFSDAFLPDKLVRRDGTGEFGIDEESTGAQEQIGMLVRLALGSLLARVDEPAVAILDDPLTHCDVGRLNKMRGILRRAAEGDSKLTPHAGPLQIIILTCHPEWFRDERATVIDLENLDVMQRFAV
jgi:predicted  nucleic acid-binding Zn-ribbon protein